MFRLLFKQKSSKQIEDFQQLTLDNKQTLYGNLQDIISLPENEDQDEWIALNICEFQAQIKTVENFIKLSCSQKQCEMSAGSFQYTWPGALRQKKLTAADYTEIALKTNDDIIKNQSIFPLDFTGVFPKDFTKICGNICRRIFRIYAHLFYNHLDCFPDSQDALNTYFQHFIMFCKEFNLLTNEDLEPMQDVIQNICEGMTDEKQLEDIEV